jgi:predicted dienelactone hydrolase
VQEDPSTPGTLRRIFRFVRWVFVLCASAIVLLFALLWSDHFRSTSLPTPTGPFAVGRAIYDWTDADGLDPLAPAPNTKRELLVWVWYPAERRSSDKVADYLPQQLREQVARQSGFVLTQLFTRDHAKVHANALNDADISAQQPVYPLVILRAGASLEVWNHSTLAEDLASHGYVVAGIDAPYRAITVVFPDGRVIRRLPQNNPELCLEKSGADRAACISRILNAWTSDIRFVVDHFGKLQSSESAGKFAGRVNTAHVGIFGHSFGGAQTAQFCSDDARCQAGVDIDGELEGPVIHSGLCEPFMILLSDHDREHDPDKEEILANLRGLYDTVPDGEREFLWIRGANHYLFGDGGALIRNHIVIAALRMFGIVRIDPKQQLAATSYCLRQFFDKFLKGDAKADINLPNPAYPQLATFPSK